jgi:xylulokinase
MGFTLGLDVSTTATKAVVLDEDGRVMAVASDAYEVSIPRPGWSEQDPDRWWQAASIAIRTVLSSAGIDGAAVEAVGLTGQMHGLVLLDAAGEVLRPAILWNDQRTAAQCDQIRERVGPARLVAVTGNDAMTGFTAPKLLWVREHEPAILERVAHVLLPKDLVRLRLTGEYALDKADGAGTLLFDVAARDWSPEVLAALELDAAWFPTTFEGPEVTGRVTAAAAQATGLRAGTPVVAGGGDQAANAVGVGAIDPGTVALSLGTSGVVFAATNAPVIEPAGRVHAFCHAVPDRWHLMGVMLSAAGSLRWFRDALAPGTSFEQLSTEAAEAPPGSEGLLFLPYLTGERTPYPDPLVRGAFVGLDVQHQRHHLVRAVMEGVAFGLRDALDLMLEAGLAQPQQIRASGGGINSPVWRQILADVLRAEIVTVDTTEGAAAGAGLLATVGAGWHASVHDAVRTAVNVTPAAEPGPARERYAERHAQQRPAATPTSPMAAPGCAPSAIATTIPTNSALPPSTVAAVLVVAGTSRRRRVSNATTAAITGVTITGTTRSTTAGRARTPVRPGPRRRSGRRAARRATRPGARPACATGTAPSRGPRGRRPPSRPPVPQRPPGRTLEQQHRAGLDPHHPDERERRRQHVAVARQVAADHRDRVADATAADSHARPSTRNPETDAPPPNRAALPGDPELLGEEPHREPVDPPDAATGRGDQRAELAEVAGARHAGAQQVRQRGDDQQPDHGAEPPPSVGAHAERQQRLHGEEHHEEPQVDGQRVVEGAEQAAPGEHRDGREDRQDGEVGDRRAGQPERPARPPVQLGSPAASRRAAPSVLTAAETNTNSGTTCRTHVRVPAPSHTVSRCSVATIRPSSSCGRVASQCPNTTTSSAPARSASG